MSRSWERDTVDRLRQRFSDLVHPLRRLELGLEDVSIKFMLGEEQGAFRVHPRIPALQIWSTVKEGNSYLKALSKSNATYRSDVNRVSEVKAAREALLKARKQGVAPKAGDVEIAGRDSSRVRKSSGVLQDRNLMEVKLAEIATSVRDVRQRRRVDQESPMVVPLRSWAPVRLARSVPLKLVLYFQD
jgi:hypothetical protein